VLQRWIRPGWRADDPEFDPAKEATVLDALAGTDVPAPRLVAVDPEGAVAGDPALLVERLPGRPPIDRDLSRDDLLATLASTLVAIHRAGASGGPLAPLAAAVPAYYPFGKLDDEFRPIASRRPGLWRRALDEARRPAPATASTLIHRDFHPGNTLWTTGRLTGIVDWTSASWGSPAADLAHLRADLVARVGPQPAEVVRRAFVGAGGDVTGGRYHDLRTVFDYLTGGTAELDGPILGRFEAYLEALLETDDG